MTRMEKNLIFSLMVMAAVFFAGASVLHNSAFHRYLVSTLERGTGLKTRFADSEIKILRGVLILRNLETADSKDRFQFKADRIFLNLSSLSLIRGKFIVTNLEIDRPAVFVTQEVSQTKPSPNIFKKFFEVFEKSLLLQNLILDRIAVHDFSLQLPGGKSWGLQEGTFRMAPTLLREIEIGAKFEDATGILPSLKALELDLALKKDGGRLKKFEIDLGKAELSLKGEWKGDWEEGNLKMGGQMTAPTVLSDPLFFFTEAGFDRKTATLKKIQARLGPALLEGEGTFNIDKLLYRISFNAKDLPLESVFQKMPSVVLGPAKGIAEVSGEARGTFPRIQAEAQARIRDFRHGPLAANLAHGTVSLNWPHLDFDALVSPGTEGRDEGHVKGGITFKHLPGFEKLQAVAKGIDLKFENAPLEAIVPTLKVSGSLSGNLHLEGAKGTSVQGTGHAQVTDGSLLAVPVPSLTTEILLQPGGKLTFTRSRFQVFTLLPVEWPGSIAIETSLDPIRFSGEPVAGLTLRGIYEKTSGEFRIDSFKIRRGEGSLDGTFRYSSKAQMAATLKGIADIQWLVFLPAFFREGRGLTRVDLSASGRFDDPLLRGKVELLGDDLEIRGFPQEVSDLKGTLVIDGPNLKTHLSGKLGEGDFLLDGRMGLARWKPDNFDLSLLGRNLTIHRPNVYRLDFDADVSLKGQISSPLLEGRIDIIDGRYVKNFVVHELVLKPSDLGSEPAAWEQSIEKMALNLAVRNSGDLTIENNVATILLRSDLVMRGTYGHPWVEGILSSIEGVFHYLGEDFILSEARLEFIDPSRREPYLMLNAQQEIPPDYTVFVEVKGYLSNLDVELSSAPSLPREEVLSLIATGLTQEEIREGSRRGRPLGAEILASEISGVIDRPVAKRTGLDRFRLEASESGKLSRVTMGKNLTDRFTLGFTQDFAPESAERTLEANYYLTDNILLKGFRTREAGTTPRYQFNVSFRFRLY